MSKVHHRWKSFELVEESLVFPDGKTRSQTTLRHPGAVVIIALTEQGNVLLLKQFRAAFNDWILELPAGTVDENESFYQCAKRELPEETGYSAAQWHTLGSLYAAPGFCDEMLEIYVAQQLTHTEATSDEDEFIEVIEVDIPTLKRWSVDGTLNDSKSLAALYRYFLVHEPQ
ncbi:NUDIX hydrolase [Thaumasiovibrio subtropicus]|uniref:NUDIX hydrolase n=1 Tax=Thaumasiovibrio subtropicus TaxID=1891207 RepID=UPI001FE3D4D2|nr:NUDIX hydrolase [Thaumasiovibrio subtropicus]